MCIRDRCTGETLHTLTKTLIAVEQEGLLRRDPHRIAATPLGLKFLDTLLERFMERGSSERGVGTTPVNVIEIKKRP